MATEITWVISRLDCLPSVPEGTDYVVTAYWSCNSANGDYRANVYGTCSFAVVQGEAFTPYADLTQEQVLGWCWANGVDKESAEAAVTGQIEAQINPPIVSPPLPWSAQP
ncbi:MAG: hypothetical protein ACO3ED_09285 [Ilumatobacteraceae bacterium]